MSRLVQIRIGRMDALSGECCGACGYPWDAGDVALYCDESSTTYCGATCAAVCGDGATDTEAAWQDPQPAAPIGWDVVRSAFTGNGGDV